MWVEIKIKIKSDHSTAHHNITISNVVRIGLSEAKYFNIKHIICYYFYFFLLSPNNKLTFKGYFSKGVFVIKYRMDQYNIIQEKNEIL